MATDTPHLVGRFSFADTLRECFGLAERANPVIRVAGQNEIVDEVRQLVSRLKIGQGTPRLLDGDATLEMTPHADGIAPIGRQLRGVHNRSARLHVRGTLAVAPLARYPSMRKQWLLVAVFRSRKRRLRIAGVTGKTGEYSRKVHGDFAIFLIGRRHVPKALLAIPVDGCFKHKAVLREKIRAAAVARADEIEELLFSLNHIVAGTIKTHPCLAVFGVNVVMHARGRVHEISREQTLHGRAAGLRHGRRRVALVNLSVAFRASFIPQIVLQGGLRWLSARSRRSLLGERGAGKGSGQLRRGGQKPEPPRRSSLTGVVGEVDQTFAQPESFLSSESLWNRLI